ncbi:MAG: putative protein YibL [Candidatus Erwinia impunctatus]|nr:putative protein YibL [Culicoides impunctatus]
MKSLVQDEIRNLSNKLDALTHKEAPLLAAGESEKLAQLLTEKDKLQAEITRLRGVQEQVLSKEAQKLAKMPFKRAITKKEQANMGALKKSVRGLVVVHPMTSLGREMGLQEMTGFAHAPF